MTSAYIAWGTAVGLEPEVAAAVDDASGVAGVTVAAPPEVVDDTTIAAAADTLDGEEDVTSFSRKIQNSSTVWFQ